MNWEWIIKNRIFGPNPGFPSFGYFFVPGPLGDAKLVPQEVFGPNDSIENISINIWKKCQNESFLRDRHFGQKWQIFKLFFFHSFMPPGNPTCRKTPMGMIAM